MEWKLPQRLGTVRSTQLCTLMCGGEVQPLEFMAIFGEGGTIETSAPLEGVEAFVAYC